MYCADFSSIFADEQEDPQFAQLLRRMKVMDDEGNAEMDEDQLDAASASGSLSLSLLPPLPSFPDLSECESERADSASLRAVLYLGFAFVKTDEEQEGGRGASATLEEVPAA